MRVQEILQKYQKFFQINSNLQILPVFKSCDAGGAEMGGETLAPILFIT